MNTLSDFQFLRPLWLTLIPVALIWWFVVQNTRANAGWGNFIAPDRLQQLLLRPQRRRFVSVLLIVPVVFASIALAGPAWQQVPGRQANAVDVRVFVLDLSPSMLAQDIAPDRLTRARLKLIDMLRLRHGQESALIVYAGDEHQVTPLTDDPATIESLVSTLHPDIMPVPGARAEAAIDMAARLIQQANYTRGDIVLITDGLHADAVAAIRDSLPPSMRLSILGVGGETGAPIPTKSGFLLDASGNMVFAAQDSDRLRQLARDFNGRYSSVTDDGSDIEYITALPSLRAWRGDDDGTQQRYDHYEDAGYWLMLLLVPLAVVGYRKNLLWCALLYLSLAPVEQSAAFDWQALWLNDDQRGARALIAGDAELAATLFNDARWRAIAHYRAGNYLESVSQLPSPEYAEDLYNSANALALSGDYVNAIKRYDLALLLYTQDESEKIADTIYNRTLVKQMLDAEKDKQEGEDDADGAGDPAISGESNQSSDGAEASQTSSNSTRQSAVGGDSGGDDSLNQQSAIDQQGVSTTQDRDDEDTDPLADDASARDDEPAADLDPGDNDEAEDELSPVEVSSGNAVLTPYSEQWLRELPKDPGGYLRRKFHYESARRSQRDETIAERQASEPVRY